MGKHNSKSKNHKKYSAIAVVPHRKKYLSPSFPQGKEQPLLLSPSADHSMQAEVSKEDPLALPSSAVPAAEAPAPTGVLSLSLPKSAKGTVPRSKSLSGKAHVETTRASNIGRSVRLKTTWDEKKAAREDRKRLLMKMAAVQDGLKEAKQREKHRLQQRREAREANEKKSMVVQKITDTRKIKKMSRKQLRLLTKA